MCSKFWVWNGLHSNGPRVHLLNGRWFFKFDSDGTRCRRESEANPTRRAYGTRGWWLDDPLIVGTFELGEFVVWQAELARDFPRSILSDFNRQAGKSGAGFGSRETSAMKWPERAGGMIKGKTKWQKDWSRAKLGDRESERWGIRKLRMETRRLAFSAKPILAGLSAGEHEEVYEELCWDMVTGTITSTPILH